MIELKPCPFCGGKMRLLGKDPVKIGIVMDCTECHIRVAVPWAYDAEHGIPTFNKRAFGWIPCSERLPEKDGRYLCVWLDNSVATLWFSNKHFRFCGEIDSLVTHWMPLPEPPEKEKEQKKEIDEAVSW